MARIAFVGQLFEGSTALGRVRALQSLGHEVKALELFPPEEGVTRLVRSLRRRTGFGPSHPINRELLELAASWRPDVLWVEKGLHVTARTVAAFRRLRPGARLIQYTNDRTAVPGNTSVDLMECLPLFDLIATTARGEEEFLLGRGARRVLRTWHGYDPGLFRRPAADQLDRSLANRIVFVGSFEAERAATLAALIDAGLPVTIVSRTHQWEGVGDRPGDVEWRRELVYGPGYPVLLASGAIALGFLRKLSRDEHTQRSFEIPASGGLLLAERTREHLELFEEGREAEFFSSNDECIAKCKRLLADPARRGAIVEAGHVRCVSSGYSWDGRVRSILAEAGVG